MKPVIKPEIINILSSYPTSDQQRTQKTDFIPNTEPEQKTFWSKVGDFFKKTKTIVKPIMGLLTAIALTLNAISRFRNVSYSHAGGY